MKQLKLVALMKMAVRALLVAILFVLLVGLLIITIQFTFRFVEWLSLTIFSDSWG